MKRFTVILLLFCVAIALTAFTPLFQTDGPIVSVNIEALTAQVEKLIAAKYDELIANLTARVVELEAKVSDGKDILVVEVEPTPEGTLTPTPNPSGYDCKTNVVLPYYFGQFAPGMEFLFTVEIENSGSKTWGSDVTILQRSGLKAEIDEKYAYALPLSNVLPGDQFEINIAMLVPEEKTRSDGKYESLYVLSDGKEDFCEFSYYIYVP